MGKIKKLSKISGENKVGKKEVKKPVSRNKTKPTIKSPAKTSVAGPAKEDKESLGYTVLKDTREQQGWTFEQGKFCNGTIPRALKTGDYTLLGYENVLCVERKKNVAEFAGNIVEKRFERELERMESFLYSFIICEFTLADIMAWPPFYYRICSKGW
jgi:ERCC4-type nuclease